MATNALTVYLWDTDIGRFIAVASDIETARSQVMGELSMKDSARNELANAIKGQPTVLGDKPLAILAYEQ